MPNLNTAKLQTHVSFGEILFQRVQKSTKWHLPLGCAYDFAHQNKFTKRHARSCFRMKYFHESARYKLSNARKPSAARARASLRGLFCLNFEAPCRFRILIISLIRENWGINFGEMKDHG